jgi:dienelactone hydrolase
MLRTVLKFLGGLVVIVILGLIIGYVATGPSRPASDSISAQWLGAGPYRVGQTDFTFIDSSRPTAENRGVPGSPERRFPTTVWYPLEFSGDSPLIIHSHGILSSRSEMPYLMELLASHGYVVAATDYPLTSGSTAGGANATDVINQPADISFLIDSILALEGDNKPFASSIDTSRIGLSGYSLGGLTTYLATYHPRLRDPRISAAVAIAGPSAAFAPEYFTHSSAPALAIAGTADALIEYERNAQDLPERTAQISVVAIDGGSHLGFIGAAEPTFRLMHNPDTLGCTAVLGALGENPNAVFATLGEVAEGVDMSRDLPPICGDEELDEAMHPAEQHYITQVAALAFFESVYAQDATRRDAASVALRTHLQQDFAAASFAER